MFYSDDCGLANFFSDCEEPAVIIMQYTGLKDMNGKEIYEGDIIYEHCTNAMDEKQMSVVEWISEADGYDSTGFLISRWLKKPCEVEVIGDIYKNPDLLKETQ